MQRYQGNVEYGGTNYGVTPVVWDVVKDKAMPPLQQLELFESLARDAAQSATREKKRADELENQATDSSGWRIPPPPPLRRRRSTPCAAARSGHPTCIPHLLCTPACRCLTRLPQEVIL